MGTIKDIIDLITQLSKSNKDRKLATEISQIQSLISMVQIENSSLVSENLELKKKIFELEKEISNFKQEHMKAISALRDKYVFNETVGVFESKETGHYFCTSCLLSPDARESPLTEGEMGWSCEYKDCNKFYNNPNWRPPQNRGGGGSNSWMGT